MSLIEKKIAAMAAKFTSRRAKRGAIDATGKDRPTPKDLYNHVVLQAAVKWKDLGVQLLDPPSESVLDIIKEDHPQNVRECCKCVFRKWLDKTPGASWNQLLDALRSPCVELNHLADQIEHKLNMDKTSESEIEDDVVTNTDSSKNSYTKKNYKLSSSDLQLENCDKDTNKTKLSKIQNTNEDAISDSIPVSCQSQVKENNITNNHLTEAMLQHPLMLQYGDLNVTNSSSSRPHHDGDHTNIVNRDNKDPDVSIHQPSHNGNEIMPASPQLIQLPNVNEQGHMTNTSEHLGASMTNLPSANVSRQQPVPPLSEYHGHTPAYATRSHTSRMHSQHQQQNPINMKTVSTEPQKTLGYQDSGRGYPSTQAMFQYSSLTHQEYFHNTGPTINQTPPTNWPYPQHTSIQYHDSGPIIQQPDKLKGKKVFILHYASDDSNLIQAVESLATFLVEIGVDVSIDLFEKDPGTVENWSIWYEDEILRSNVVLCIITPNFNSRIKKVSIYNLMSDQKDIAFRAVFLDSQKVTKYIPLSMRGSTCYCISSQRLNLEDEGFASLYTLLTGQNRIEKPPVGEVLRLRPKRSKFAQCHGNQQVTSIPTKRYEVIPQQRSFTIQSEASCSTMSDKTYPYVTYSHLKNNTTPIESLPSHQTLLMTLAANLAADWEFLGRMLEVSETDIYAIRRDYRESTAEQAVQMLKKWLDTNGSRATVAVISTAVYESGLQYWNLLDILYKKTIVN